MEFFRCREGIQGLAQLFQIYQPSGLSLLVNQSLLPVGKSLAEFPTDRLFALIQRRTEWTTAGRCRLVEEQYRRGYADPLAGIQQVLGLFERHLRQDAHRIQSRLAGVAQQSAKLFDPFRHLDQPLGNPG